MYKTVAGVHPNQDFSLGVVFEDGVEGALDVTPYLIFGVFKNDQELRAVPAGAHRV